MEIVATSKIYKNNQTTMPKAIREQIKGYDVNKTIFNWSLN